MRLNNIEAILFDSGRVLNYPVTGHWFMSPKFFSQVNKDIFNNISMKRRQHAFFMAGKYINSISVIKTQDEEYEHFIKYYEIFSKELPDLKLSHECICELAKDLVYNKGKYVFFDDAVRVIPVLHEKYKLAVVSDAWPSLKDVFIQAGFLSYFSSFVLSSVIGVTKPDKKMYLTALEELRVKPEKAVFIDDSAANCLGAKKLGIHAILLCRDKKHYILQKFKSIGKGYQVVNSLEQLIND